MPNLKKQTKCCPVCKRSFHNRKKWEARGIWSQVIYCSDKCRGQKRSATLEMIR